MTRAIQLIQMSSSTHSHLLATIFLLNTMRNLKTFSNKFIFVYLYLRKYVALNGTKGELNVEEFIQFSIHLEAMTGLFEMFSHKNGRKIEVEAETYIYETQCLGMS